jgi:hypothetical protein
MSVFSITKVQAADVIKGAFGCRLDVFGLDLDRVEGVCCAANIH